MKGRPVLLAVLAAPAFVGGGAASPHGLGLQPVVRGLDSPLYVASAPGEPSRLYVVEQVGRVRVVEDGRLLAKPFLDIRRLVTAGGEQGLLGLAFHPQFARNHLFYVHYSDLEGDTRLVEYRAGASAVRVRQLFFERQPYANHNGGQLAFGPDRRLYIGLGDGGSGGDPQNNGQTFRTKLAKIWKLNVGVPKPKPELVAYGLRNPWRFAFDRATGDLYIGDVGQNEWEEIDYVAQADRGVKNFGWSTYEGRERYSDRRLVGPGDLVQPIAVYSHDAGCSVTGGYVYRGEAEPALQGRYVYGDYCSGTIWSLRVSSGKAAVRRERIRIDGLSSFGEDLKGELYATALGGTLFRLTG